MEQEKRSLTLNGINLPHVLLMILSVSIIGISIYMTKHYYQLHFSTSLEDGGAFCNLSSFWSCDKASSSAFSNFLGIPISVFGLLFGLFLLNGSIFPTENIEKTNNFLSKINFLGCLVLFFYSLFALGGLCPMCMLYYLASTLIFVLFLLKGVPGLIPSIKILGIYSFLTLIVGVGISFDTGAKQEKQKQIAKSLIDQFDNLPNRGEPPFESPAKLATATALFADAPLRLTIFSDFQCPGCKSFSDTAHKIIEKYQGKINVQYQFYPLDNNCNPKMKYPLHPYACLAAYLSLCLVSDFATVHDEIFAAQENLSREWIEEYAQKRNVSECLKSAANEKEIVKKTLENGDYYAITGTPSLIINGVKISSIPLNQLYILFDELLARKDGVKN